MKVAPSVLTADFKNLKSEIESVREADYIHLDIMDGHFVPNISFGPFISSQIQDLTDVPMDIHLMVTDPIKWISDFALPNTSYITIHVESNHVLETIQKIKDQKIGVGLSIKPKTPIDALFPYLDELDLIVVMTVEPGFGGQSFMPEQMDKVEELVKIRRERNLSFVIEVDGGISGETIGYCKEAGVDIVVAGSYIFNQHDRKKAMDSLR